MEDGGCINLHTSTAPVYFFVRLMIVMMIIIRTAAAFILLSKPWRVAQNLFMAPSFFHFCFNSQMPCSCVGRLVSLTHGLFAFFEELYILLSLASR